MVRATVTNDLFGTKSGHHPVCDFFVGGYCSHECGFIKASNVHFRVQPFVSRIFRISYIMFVYGNFFFLHLKNSFREMLLLSWQGQDFPRSISM